MEQLEELRKKQEALRQKAIKFRNEMRSFRDNLVKEVNVH